MSYARHFAAPSLGARIITPSRGLVTPDTWVGARDLAEFAAVAVDSAEPRFTAPLFDQYMVKPVDLDTLREWLQNGSRS